MIVCTHWGVLVAQHQRHKQVAAHLVARGIDHFIPLIETLFVANGRHVRELRPLLGEYILTSINSAWRSLTKLQGVAGIMIDEASGFPAHVLPHELQRLRDMCVGDVYRSSIVEDASGFVYGQKVTPKEGPFAFYIGRYDKKTKRGDAATFTLFGREQRVLFKHGELVATENAVVTDNRRNRPPKNFRSATEELEPTV